MSSGARFLGLAAGLALLAPGCAPKVAPSVVWWSEAQGEVVTLLAVGPGSPPERDHLWVRRLFEGQPSAGGWSYLYVPPLMPLPDDVQAAVRADARPGEARQSQAGDGSLRRVVVDGEGREVDRQEGLAAESSPYREVRAAAVRLLAEQLRDPVVAVDSLRSGAWLARWTATGEEVVLELAPAPPAEQLATLPLQAVGRWLEPPHLALRVGTGEPVACESATPFPRLEATRVTVRLGDAPAVELPAARAAWPLRRTEGDPACTSGVTGIEVTLPPGENGVLEAELQLRMPECRLPASLCERWAQGTDPVVAYARVTLRAPLAPPAR